MQRRASRAVALALALVTGCSFALTRGPRPGRLHCSRSYLPPAVDAALVLSSLGLLVADLATSPDSHNAPVPDDAVRAPVLLIAFITALSAGHGFTAVARCRATARRR